MSVPDELLGTREIAAPSDMHELGRRIGRSLAPGDVVVLTGPLGAGKTTLTRGIGEGLGIRGPIQSPTFVIARTHPSLVGGTPLVHVDAYRLGAAVELDDLDIDVAHSAVIVEWGKGVAEYLADSWWEIEIDRHLGGRGVDNACGEIAVHTVELDVDAPRTVTISRRP
ncbi:tRNA (adenosine(37)-N6)-threonylcarbamoyltransferase complex ATPase subunit type 1 TsaE [Microbacterium sp. lyk4-40-TSB-66]|uniref:tRNA (adenosine(37)-N6)-threonylcarbamoyltransferase complex ATPase subunit type 1 TsaE n=1 Tax=Microbacterium sp. lyk4-40-TSB-66 TaxID=3040294 RepID=UPI002550B1C0|nr:tRNA (adenosine(37)-N6)-threonylcarbamoyltransferase complex ATPase subunit type 1 TsaE [Microbacterium sp. lyk4-40-TSB-66]